MEIKAFSPWDSVAFSDMERICSNIEPHYKKDFFRRIPLFRSKSLIRKIYIGYLNERPVGFRVLIFERNEIFRTDAMVTRTTMFRVEKQHRNRGVGSIIFEESNKKIFSEFELDKVYGATTEYGALKLYSRFSEVKILPTQSSCGLQVDEEFLNQGWDNEFVMDTPVAFYVTPSLELSR